MKKLTINDLKIGESATIKAISNKCDLRTRFIDMGVVPGTKVMLQRYAPMGDPIQILIRGYQLSIRKEQAKQIEIESIEK